MESRSGPLCFTNVVRTRGVWARGGSGSDSSDVGHVFQMGTRGGSIVVMIAHFRLDLVIFHPFFLSFIGSARRKLTCTICNRKCSSSLNLQEHRKVRLFNVRRAAQIIPARYFASDLTGFTRLMQFCMIHLYSDVSFSAVSGRTVESITLHCFYEPV